MTANQFTLSEAAISEPINPPPIYHGRFPPRGGGSYFAIVLQRAVIAEAFQIAARNRQMTGRSTRRQQELSVGETIPRAVAHKMSCQVEACDLCRELQFDGMLGIERLRMQENVFDSFRACPQFLGQRWAIIGWVLLRTDEKNRTRGIVLANSFDSGGAR